MPVTSWRARSPASGGWTCSADSRNGHGPYNGLTMINDLTAAGHLPYGGLVTFARAEAANLSAAWQADIGVLGVPYDIALGFRPGARFAPRAIREASLRYAIPEEGDRKSTRLNSSHVA